MTVGEKLKEYRKDCNLTQSNVAGKLGISEKTYWSYEHDKSKIDFISLDRFINVIKKASRKKDKGEVSEISFLDFIHCYDGKNWLSAITPDKIKDINKVLDNFASLEDVYDLTIFGHTLNDKQFLLRHILSSKLLSPYITKLSELVSEAPTVKNKITDINGGLTAEKVKGKNTKQIYSEEVISEIQRIKNEAYRLNNFFIDRVIDDYFGIKRQS